MGPPFQGRRAPGLKGPAYSRVLVGRPFQGRLVIALMLLASYQLQAQVTSDRLLRAASEARNWLTYSGSYRSERFTRLAQITPANVANLEQKWVLQTQVLGAWQAT